MTQSTSASLEPIPSRLAREDPAFAEIVVEFVQELPDKIHRLEQALRAGDWDALHHLAHQLKGSGEGYGYPILTQRAAVLEDRAMHHDQAACILMVEELKQLCARVVVS